MITNRSAPSATVVPVIIYNDVAEAIDWLCHAFGFSERLRAPGPGGEITHAQLIIAECAVMIGKAGGPLTASTNEINQYVLITVDNVQEHFDRSKQFGAEILQSPSDMPFGVRQYTVKDHAGHWWAFSQNIVDVAPEDWGAISTTNR